MKRLLYISISILILLTSVQMSAYSQNQDKKEKPKTSLKFYEFEELTIKVKIQEPEVLFILDKPNVLVEPFSEEMNFLEKIDDPIIKDNLF